MKRIKPIYISVLTILLFAIGMFFGVRSDWWILEGRKTPLDVQKTDEHVEEAVSEEHSDHDEDDHVEKTEISGSSTVQDALDLGITKQQLEEVLEGAVEDLDKKIKDIATERGLSFGKVKEGLNGLINK